jgi:hypothetical protein
MLLGDPGTVFRQGELFTIRSFINETTEIIEFATAVCRGDTSAPGFSFCKPLTADGDRIIGIAARPAWPVPAFGERSAVPVLTFGTILAQAVAPVSAGDAVIALIGGGLGGGTAGVGRVVVPGAIWLDLLHRDEVGRIRVAT